MSIRKNTATRTGRTKTTKANITTVSKVTTPAFTIAYSWANLSYYIVRNARVLLDKAGYPRFFRTRNSARKRVSRERFGDFHN